MNINISPWLLGNIDLVALASKSIGVYSAANATVEPIANCEDGGEYWDTCDCDCDYTDTCDCDCDCDYTDTCDCDCDYTDTCDCDYYDYGNYYNYYNYSNYSNYFNSVSISSNPTSQTVNEGTTASFSFSVSTGSSVTSKTYQWYYSTSSTGSGTAISGATSATYSVTGSLSNHGRYYYCICTTNGATKTVTSGRALLSVNCYRAYDIYVGIESQMQIPTASNNSTKSMTACTIANTSIASTSSDGIVTGVSAGMTTATITIGGVSKTVTIYVIDNALEALFATLANIIRCKDNSAKVYYPNQLHNGISSSAQTSVAYTTIEDMLQDLANEIRSITSTTAVLHPYQFAKKIAESFTSLV